MSDLIVALGLFLALEGAVYAAAPGFMRRAAEQASRTDDNVLRMFGVVALVLGVVLVWTVRG